MRAPRAAPAARPRAAGRRPSRRSACRRSATIRSRAAGRGAPAARVANAAGLAAPRRRRGAPRGGRRALPARAAAALRGCAGRRRATSTPGGPRRVRARQRRVVAERPPTGSPRCAASRRARPRRRAAPRARTAGSAPAAGGPCTPARCRGSSPRRAPLRRRARGRGSPGPSRAWLASATSGATRSTTSRDRRDVGLDVVVELGVVEVGEADRARTPRSGRPRRRAARGRCRGCGSCTAGGRPRARGWRSWQSEVHLVAQVRQRPRKAEVVDVAARAAQQVAVEDQDSHREHAARRLGGSAGW